MAHSQLPANGGSRQPKVVEKLDWTEVDSTNVQSVAYDEGTKTLAVQFTSGAFYTYDDVEEPVATNMVHAESVGQFLNQQIKGRYAYLRWFSEEEVLGHIQGLKR